MLSTRLVQRAINNLFGFFIGTALAVNRTNFARKRFELKNCCRPMDIHTDQHHALFIFLDQAPGQLCCSGCLVRALQTREKDDDWRLCTQIQRHGIAAQYFDKLAVNNFDEGLTGCQALADFLANGALSYPFDKRFDDR